MNLQSQANKHYCIIQSDPAAQAVVREELKTLAASMITGEATDITSATVNGQSFAGTKANSEEERFNLLREIVRRLDNGRVYSNRTRVRFRRQL